MPSPRTSIRPASAAPAAPAAGHARPRHGRGRRRRAARTAAGPARAACSSASASRDLPEPAGPRISTARAPTSTRRVNGDDHGASDLVSAARHHVVGSRTMKRAPSTLRLVAFGGRHGACGSPPTGGRDGPRRSAWRSTGRGRSSGRSPAPAGRCRSARKSCRTRPAGCPAVVVDDDLDLVAEPPAGDAHRAVGRRERARVVDQIVDHLAEPRIVAGHHEGERAAAFEGDRHLRVVGRAASRSAPRPRC